MLIKKIITVAITALIANYSIGQTVIKDSTIAENKMTTSYNVAIFPGSFPVLPNFEGFTPTMNEIDLAERALSRELWRINKDRKHQDEDKVIHQRLSRYNRQYFGYINAAGEKVLLIKSFWREGETDGNEQNWLNEVLKPTASGGKSWSIEYNITQNKLYDFYVPSPTATAPITTVE